MKQLIVLLALWAAAAINEDVVPPTASCELGGEPIACAAAHYPPRVSWAIPRGARDAALVVATAAVGATGAAGDGCDPDQVPSAAGGDVDEALVVARGEPSPLGGRVLQRSSSVGATAQPAAE